MPASLAYIAEVRISPAMEAKIRQKHGVTGDEVREAVILTPLERARWHEHPQRGWRLLVTGTTYAGRRLNLVLYPVDAEDGTWSLGTAMSG